MKKENKNFLYNVVYQIFSLLMPLITAPYISRVLGVDNIGLYSYTYSIVSYFMLAAMLGINNYGSREIAKISQKNDRKKLSEKFCEIYYLQFGLGIIMSLIYFSGVLLFSGTDRVFLLAQGVFLVSSMFDINWFYFGLEKFKITVSRNMIIKLLSLVMIFILVRSEVDLMKYILIMGGSALMSQLYLWIYLKKYVSFLKRKTKDIFKHFKSCLVLFIPVIAYSIYRIMDKTMLGLMTGNTPLGYYQNAESIINIPVVLITALGTVMLPSMSKSMNKDRFDDKLFGSFKLLFSFVIPIVVSLIILGPDFSVVFYGNDFAESGAIMRTLAITAIFAAIANVIRTNYLIPKHKDKIYVFSTIIGALVNLVCNMALIPLLGVYGACIGTILAEFCVMIYQVIAVRRDIDFGRILSLLLKGLIKSVPICIAQIAVCLLFDDSVLRLIYGGILTVLLFAVVNYKYFLYEFFGLKKVK